MRSGINNLTAPDCGASGAPANSGTTSPRIPSEIKWTSEEIIVFRKRTWGRFGQHNNIYCFVIDPDKQTITPIWKIDSVAIRFENNDSNKNYNRYMLLHVSELSKLSGKILKFVFDAASSKKRDIYAKYYAVVQNELIELEAERGLRDSGGFYDLVKMVKKLLKVRKDSVEVVE